MVAVDTNVLVRWLLRDNQVLAVKADALLNQAKAGSVLLDRIILAEFSYVLKSYYKYPRERVAVNLQTLLQAELFSISNRSLVEQTVSAYAAYPSLSFEDCWLQVQYASGRVDGVLSFDDGLQKRLTAN